MPELKNKSCTGRFDKMPNSFASELHRHCFGCQRKAVRPGSSHHGFILSPVSLFVGDVCLGRVAPDAAVTDWSAS